MWGARYRCTSSYWIPLCSYWPNVFWLQYVNLRGSSFSRMVLEDDLSSELPKGWQAHFQELYSSLTSALAPFFPLFHVPFTLSPPHPLLASLSLPISFWSLPFFCLPLLSFPLFHYSPSLALPLFSFHSHWFCSLQRLMQSSIWQCLSPRYEGCDPMKTARVEGKSGQGWKPQTNSELLVGRMKAALYPQDVWAPFLLSFAVSFLCFNFYAVWFASMVSVTVFLLTLCLHSLLLPFTPRNECNPRKKKILACFR